MNPLNETLAADPALAEYLPRAMLSTYPDAGHGSLFQYHESFVRQASQFLDSEVL
jgi:hypothetical protein